jgi:hypothetical protein
MPATWLTVLAWSCFGMASACAAVVVLEVYVRGHRQRMTVMEIV